MGLDLRLDLEETFPVKSVDDLKREFYRYHRLKDSEKGPEQKGKTVVLAPISLVLNPDIFSGDILQPDKYYAVYYRSYYVIITQGRSGVFGPHKVELCYQVYVGKDVWLGTAVFRCNFFDLKAIQKALRLAIKRREYYCSESSGEQIVELDHPNLKVIRNV